MKDADYIKSKIKHMKHIMGINAAVNPATGAAQPDWAKAEAEERRAHHMRDVKRRAERDRTFHREED
jgi:hypothetical protein